MLAATHCTPLGRQPRTQEPKHACPKFGCRMPALNSASASSAAPGIKCPNAAEAGKAGGPHQGFTGSADLSGSHLLTCQSSDMLSLVLCLAVNAFNTASNPPKSGAASCFQP